MAIVTDVPTGILPPTAPPTSGPPPSVAGTAVPGSPPGRRDEHSLFGADGLTFRDLLDMINPLQHLPVVSHIYRAITDDELSPGARMVGGGVFGGFIGLGIAMFNTVLEDLTGKDLGEHVIAFFTGSDDPEGGPGTLPPEAPPTVLYAAVAPRATGARGPLPSSSPPPGSSSPLAEPAPVVPPLIPAVYRKPLPPPGPLAAATSEPAQSDPTPDALETRPRPIARRPRARARALTLNTELFDMLLYSVPFHVGGGSPSDSRGGPGTRPTEEDLSSVLGDDGPPPSVAALAAGHQAYANGQATRAAAVAGGVFTPLGLEDML